MPIQTFQGNLDDMLKEGPIYGRDMELAHLYCKGNGVELGAAAHNPFNLPGSINVAPFSDQVDHVDYRDFMLYRGEQVKLCGHYAKIDLVGEAHAVPVDDASQNYVISSHVVEHLPDLISAFEDWNRILKPGGIIFMIFPKRDVLPSDAARPVTPLSHFIEDYALRRTVATHNSDAGIRGHYHVFTLGSMLELIYWCNSNINLNWKVEAVEETDSKWGNGHTVVCRYVPETNHRQLQKQNLLVKRPTFSFGFLWMRTTQLMSASVHLLRTEGPMVFVKRLARWLRGERRYFGR
jgi:SAM-dependent methyltransferase